MQMEPLPNPRLRSYKLLLCVVLSVVQTVALAACQATKEEPLASTEMCEIVYGVSGGQPPVSASLQISPSGQADLFLGSSWSLPTGTDQIGFFSGQVAAEKLSDLNKHLIRHNFLSRSDDPTPTAPDSAVRHLHLHQAGKETAFTITDTSNDAPLASLEDMLVGIMSDLTAEPLRAIHAAVAATTEGDKIHSTVTLTHQGSEPLSVLFFDPDSVNMYARVQLAVERLNKLPSGIELPMALGGLALSRDEIAALVDQGFLPNGVQSMEPGDTFSFELPPTQRPAAGTVYARVTLTFWLPTGEGQGHIVHVQTKRSEID